MFHEMPLKMYFMKYSERKVSQCILAFTDADYAHAKRVCKEFETKKLGEYHGFYVQSNTLLLADVFENFRSMCLEIYELDPAKFLSMVSSFKKD